jgi:hypothetical protein
LSCADAKGGAAISAAAPRTAARGEATKQPKIEQGKDADDGGPGGVEDVPKKRKANGFTKQIM